MSQLTVSALAATYMAAPGSANHCLIALAVVDQAGIPVTELTTANINLQTMMLVAGASTARVSKISAATAGAYAVQVVPSSTATWVAGEYIFYLTVTRGQDKGMALAKIRVG